MRAIAAIAIIILAAFLVDLGGLQAKTKADSAPILPFFNTPDWTPRWINPEDVPADFHRVPDFKLTDHHGQAISAETMNGNITIVDFFFTQCGGICPRLARSMSTIEAALPADAPVVLLSYSVTPEHDTVEQLASYAKRMGITSARWHLLTGERSLIYALGRQSLFVEEDLGEPRGPDQFLHTENVVLLDGKRRLRGVYNGINSTSVQQLITDAKQLLINSTGYQLPTGDSPVSDSK